MSDLYSEVALATGVSRPLVKSVAIQIMYGKLDGVQRHSDLVKALTAHVNDMVKAGLLKKMAVATDEEKAERLAEELKRPGGLK